MKPLNKILVPVDLSESSLQIVQHAIEIANRCHAEIILLHVYNRPLHRISGKRFFEKKYIQSLESRMLQWRERRVKSKFDLLKLSLKNAYDVKFTIIKTRGLLLNRIKETIKNYGADLVIMGTGNTTKTGNIWDYKVARISKKIRVPLLVLPFNAEVAKPAKIAFAYDLKSIPDLEDLNMVKIFSSLYNAEVHIFTVKQNNNFSKEEMMNLDQLKSYFKEFAPVFHTVDNDDIKNGILQYLHKYHISIVTILHRSRNLFERMMHKSISKSMALESDVPVLTLDEH